MSGNQRTASAAKTLERLAEPVFSLNRSLVVIDCNERARELLERVGVADPTGSHVSDVDPVQGRQSAVAAGKPLFDVALLERAAETGQRSSYERYLACVERWYELRLYPDSGQLTVLCLDGTVKQREQIPERYRAVVENAPDVITQIDPDGAITYVSQTPNNVFGREPGELIGENALEYVHPEDKQSYRQQLNKLLENKETRVQYRLDHPERGWIWVESTGCNQIENGAIGGILLVSREITERKEIQHRLEDQRDNLQLLNQVVRHDIRNDIQLILTHGELLDEQIEESEKNSVETILSNAEDARQLTDQARLLADVIRQPETEIGTQSLRETLTEEIAAIRSSYEAVTVRLDGEIPAVSVRGNGMLHSVFDNLLTNAVVHNDSEKPVVTISAERTGDAVEIQFADNGPGVADDRKDEIFGRGQKGIDSDGTGLGLYLVDRVLTQCGGGVWVADRSASNTADEQATRQGAVFVVRLPVAEVTDRR